MLVLKKFDYVRRSLARSDAWFPCPTRRVDVRLFTSPLFPKINQLYIIGGDGTHRGAVRIAHGVHGAGENVHHTRTRMIGALNVQLGRVLRKRTWLEICVAWAPGFAALACCVRFRSKHSSKASASNKSLCSTLLRSAISISICAGVHHTAYAGFLYERTIMAHESGMLGILSDVAEAHSCLISLSLRSCPV